MTVATWYFSKNEEKHVRQIIVRLPPENEIPSAVDRKLLADPGFMRANWAATVIVPSGSHNPAIFAKASGVVEMLRGNSVEVAFAYYHLSHGGLVQIFVSVDSPGVKLKFGYPYLAEHPLCPDDEKDREIIEAFLSTETVQVFFVAPGQKDPLAGYFGLEAELTSECREMLKSGWQTLHNHHIGINVRDFELCLEQYNNENPIEQSPVLAEDKASYQPKRASLPHEAGDFYSRGMKLVEREDWEGAAKEFGTAVDLAPASPTLRYALAIAKSKNAPEGMSHEDLKGYYMDVCELFEFAIRLDEGKAELQSADYCKIAFTCGLLYRSVERYLEALQILNQGLQRNPKDRELLELRAWSELDLGLYQDAERTILRLLEFHPRSEEGRKLWKKIRKIQGKELDLDLAENKKREIFRDYIQSWKRAFLRKYGMEKADLDFNELVNEMNRRGSNAAAEVRRDILNRYELNEFDLMLILQEGERHAWPTE